jgi:predicted membrane-bound dolichyl-phosphate-mannose-protein mannosyltransferase
MEEVANKKKKFSWNNTRWQNLALFILIFLSLALHIATINNPTDTVFDEYYYTADSYNITQNMGTERVEHTPVGKLFIAAGIMAFGNNPIGWRLPSIIVGTLMLVLFYDICRRLNMKHKYAFLATMLLAFETTFFLHSSIAMLDIFMVFFSFVAFWLYLKGWYELCAVAIALSGLAKISGVLTGFPIVFHWLFTGFRQSIAKIPEGTNYPLFKRLVIKYGETARFILSMFLAPLSFVLMMPLFDWIIWGHWIDPVAQIANMGSMTKAIGFDAYLNPETGLYNAPIPTRPWEWILSPTGAFYFYGWLFNPEKYTICVLGYTSDPDYTCMLNPTTWIYSMALLPYGIYKWIKTKGSAFIFAVCWMIGTWAVWIPISIMTDRSSFLFYFLPTVGACCLIGALIIEDLIKHMNKTPSKAKRLIEKIILMVLIVGHLVAFCVLSPDKLYISIPISLIVLALTIDQLGFDFKLNYKDDDLIEEASAEIEANEERQEETMNEPIANKEYDILSIPESEFDFGPEFDDDSDCEI